MSSPFGWDYPAGVTGNEPQIAGGSEKEMAVECGEVGCRVVPTEEVKDRLNRLITELLGVLDTPTSKAMPKVEKVFAQVRELRERIELNEDWADFDCPFKDEVTVTVYGDEGRWTCPVCGTEHEVDLTPEIDPDEAMEARRGY